MPQLRSLILPFLGYAGYPLILVGATAVFGLSTFVTLQMVSAHITEVVPDAAAASPDFNLPPVEQIGELHPPPAGTASQEPAEAAVPESSIVAVAPPGGAVAVSLSPPAQTFQVAVEAPAAEGTSTVEAGAPAGRVGGQAVNVRAGPSNNAVALGVLNAGTAVRIGENVGGWIHVEFDGGEGWVYKTFLETNSITALAD